VQHQDERIGDCVRTHHVLMLAIEMELSVLPQSRAGDLGRQATVTTANGNNFASHVVKSVLQLLDGSMWNDVVAASTFTQW